MILWTLQPAQLVVLNNQHQSKYLQIWWETFANFVVLNLPKQLQTFGAVHAPLPVQLFKVEQSLQIIERYMLDCHVPGTEQSGCAAHPKSQEQIWYPAHVPCEEQPPSWVQSSRRKVNNRSWNSWHTFICTQWRNPPWKALTLIWTHTCSVFITWVGITNSCTKYVKRYLNKFHIRTEQLGCNQPALHEQVWGPVQLPPLWTILQSP